MATIAYKPISRDEPVGITGVNNSMPAALGRRVADNSQFLLQERLPKTAIAFNGAATNTNLAGNPDASDLAGYYGRVGGGSTIQDPNTIGLQFSTHPGNPLIVPIPFQWTGLGNTIRVFISLACTDTVSIGASYFNGEATFPNIVPDLDRNTYLGSGFFNQADLGSAAIDIGDTATFGTAGVSYVMLDIKPPNFPAGQFEDRKDTFVSEAATKNGIILLTISSHLGSSAGTETINDILADGYLIQMGANFAKYAPAGTENPGKFHKVAKLTIKNSPNTTETYHHVIQYRPADINDPWGASVLGQFAIHPPIYRPYLDNSNVEIGDTFELFDITKITLFGVSVQEMTR